MHKMNILWIAGERVCIDEIMILYTGRTITFVQYMPLKPINHRIKLFMLTCKSHTLGRDTYLGKDYPLDLSAEATVVCLITNAGLIVQSSRIIYTNNWYTSIKLARTLFKEYNWLFFVTSSPTGKKTREEYDIPFHKLSNFDLNYILRGCSRRATTHIIGGNGKKGIFQV